MIDRQKLRLDATITIAEVTFDHDHGCSGAYIQLEGKGWSQAFGGVMRSREQGERFLAAAQRILDVAHLPGAACVALYADVHHGTVTGIECPRTGKRFCMRTFDNVERMAGTPPVPSPTEKEREKQLAVIRKATWAIEEAAVRLRQCEELVDWSEEPLAKLPLTEHLCPTGPIHQYRPSYDGGGGQVCSQCGVKE